MAASLALLSASPNSLRYLWSTDGAGSQAASRTKAEMLADCATAGPGPSTLMAFLTPLTGAAGPGGWASMDQTATGSKGARLHVSLYVTNSTNGICAKLAFTGIADLMTVEAQAGGGAVAADDEIIVDLHLRNTLA